MSLLPKPPDKMNENELAKVVVNQCFQIHLERGPGLLESAYEAILVYRLRKQGFFVEQQKGIPLYEDGVKLDIAFRADVIVQRKLLLELKSVSRIDNSVPKTVLTYLKLSNLKLGLIVNFGEEYIKDGLKRVINGKIE